MHLGSDWFFLNLSLAVILHIILYIYTHRVRGSTDHLWNLTFLKAANNELSKYYLWQSCIRDGFQQCSVSCKEFPLESCPVMAKDCFCCCFFSLWSYLFAINQPLLPHLIFIQFLSIFLNSEFGKCPKGHINIYCT